MPGVTLDAMPVDRRCVVRALLFAEGGGLTSGEVNKAVGQSRPTIRKGMESLGVLGAVAVGMEGKSKKVSLLESELWLRDPAFKWVLTCIPQAT